MEWWQYDIQRQDGADDPARAINRGEEKANNGKNTVSTPSTGCAPEFNVCV